jgi:hypothetical protein
LSDTSKIIMKEYTDMIARADEIKGYLANTERNRFSRSEVRQILEHVLVGGGYL